ncbi:MAG: hypothetical protein IJX38_06195 [Clostridia bacterium]|nr:hypothetical protein [Clostridia bacterium]
MSVYFDKRTKSFFLDGKDVTYAFFIKSFGYAEHPYLGTKIPHDHPLYTRASGGINGLVTPPGMDRPGGDLILSGKNLMNADRVTPFPPHGDFKTVKFHFKKIKYF